MKCMQWQQHQDGTLAVHGGMGSIKIKMERKQSGVDCDV